MTALKHRALSEPAITPPSADVVPRAHALMPTAPLAVAPSSGDMAPRVASPEPMHPLAGRPATPSHPDRKPRPTVTPSKSDVITRPHTPGVPVTPHACTPAMNAPTTLCARTSVSLTKGPAPITAPPQAPAERTPTAIVHGPRDLSTLCSDAPNPWGSLRRRRYGRYPHMSRQFTHRKQYPSIHPVNTHLQTVSVPKPPTSAPICVFETVRHPHGIGPTKIRVPLSATSDIPVYPSSHMDPAIAPSTLPSPLTHPIVTVQCHCGQFVPISQSLDTQIQTSTTSISDILSHSLSIPLQFFSRFRFS